MIDRAARNQLAEQMRHFVTGLTDNFAYDDRVFSIQSNDAVVISIRHEMWFVYDDLSRHKLKGKWALSEQDKATILRCILFLKFDIQYRWPEKPRKNFLKTLLRFLTLGLVSNHPDRQWEANGEIEVWPFLKVEEFNAAKQKPVYLAHVF